MSIDNQTTENSLQSLEDLKKKKKSKKKQPKLILSLPIFKMKQ